MPQVKYEQILPLEYTALADNETEIYLPDMIGCRVVKVERNIKPLVDYEYDDIAGKMKITNGLGAGETLFILYAKIITQ
jgi:hypothetical protein